MRNCVRCGLQVARWCDSTAPWFTRCYARGLCGYCYMRCLKLGTLTDYERTTYTAAELVAEYEFLARYEGMSRAQVASRLGIKRSRLDKALERQRKRMVA